MNILRIAAFSDGVLGGNPAGVCIADTLSSAADMQRIAAEVGFVEAHRDSNGLVAAHHYAD